MVSIDFDVEKTKLFVFNQVEIYLQYLGFQIVSSDSARPWGGFFVINENQSDLFIKTFFPEIPKDEISITNKLSPKILVVAPKVRLSWQYHFRRAEIWKLIGGTAAISTNTTDEESTVRKIDSGSVIKLKQGERHRLIGTNGWGIIAEIWQHTDISNPSDESDIVRVQDDFGR